MEQVKGIEPSSQAWEACVLPMNYTCIVYILYAHFTQRVNRILSKIKHIIYVYILLCREIITLQRWDADGTKSGDLRDKHRKAQGAQE